MIIKQIKRISLLPVLGLGTIVITGSQSPTDTGQTDQPNILWLVSEDNGPFLGCYGDEYATTPNLDKLASEGVLYTNAFANAPVCAPARSTIISGMYASSLGTEHMRSVYPIPKEIKFFPQYLREAGYYCTNNAKEDYNMPKPDGVWDESSRKAHYKNREKGQPFFSIFNISISHESSIHRSLRSTKHDPVKVKLPPYHPDTPEIRHDWAQYYDKVEAMDSIVGRFLNELEKEGLAENTIVFYYSDHGGVLPRSKRFLYNSGTRVPFIVRFPKKYQHLASDNPGTKTDRIISFVDLAPTILSLTGINIPDHIQGKAFLGKQQSEPGQYAFLFRGRMDERYDMMRAVRDKQFKYIRNYMPQRIYGQHLNYLWRAPATRSWEKAYKDGKCNATQRIFWETKPVEELYDVTIDPHEVKNLAEDPEYYETLIRMRQVLRNRITEIHDVGFIPEGERKTCFEGTAAYTAIREPGFPLERIIETAEMASEKSRNNIPELMNRLRDKDNAVRYWAATGFVILGERIEPAVTGLSRCLKDSSADVRIAAAEALCVMNETEKGLPVLISELQNDNVKASLHAINVLQCLGEQAHPALEELIKIQKNSKDNYIQQAAMYAVESLTNNE
jgi:N-sulfoglucosamine sulfohydrolase